MKQIFELSKPCDFSLIVKPIGQVCNLNCTYCYYLEKLKLCKDRSGYKMNDEALKNFIKNYIEAQQSPVILFVWQSGEPTLTGID